MMPMLRFWHGSDCGPRVHIISGIIMNMIMTSGAVLPRTMLRPFPVTDIDVPTLRLTPCATMVECPRPLHLPASRLE